MAKSTIKTDYSSEEIEGLIEEFSSKLETLRIRYEQYFVGAEKKPPTQLRMDVARIMRLFEQLSVTNSTNKFRIRTLTQKFTSYSTYWNRTQREIEDGTYQRNVAKAQREQERIKRTEAQKKSVPTTTARASKGATGVADEAEAFLASLGLTSSGFDDDDMSDTPPTPVAAVTPQPTASRPTIAPMPGAPSTFIPKMPNNATPQVQQTGYAAKSMSIPQMPGVAASPSHFAQPIPSVPQMPGVTRPPVPQMPGVTRPAVPQMPVASQVPPVANQRPAVPPMAAANQRPAVQTMTAANQRPAVQPMTAANQRPAVQPMTAANQRPAVQPMPAANQRPAVQPMTAANQRPAVQPIAAANQRPAVHPTTAANQRPAVHPTTAANQRPAVQPMTAANQRPAVQPMTAANQRPLSPSTQSNPTITRQPSAQTTSAARPVVPQRSMTSGQRPAISSHQPQVSRSGIAPRITQRAVPQHTDDKK